MTVNLSALGGAGQQFFDNNGNVLTGGKLWSYQAGTTTPQTTYTSASGATAHTNPIVLDSAGRIATGEIWVTAGQNYKFVLMTSANVTIATWDNITGINGTGITSNAESVIYDPPFTGASTSNYTVEDKLAQTISVKDFGAVGDGVTDDTAAIQAALNEAGNIYIPEGTYIVAPLDVLDDTTLTFSSKATLLAKSGAYIWSDCLLNIAVKNNVTIFGNGATIQMRKSEYPLQEVINGNLINSEYRHCVIIISSSNVRIYDLVCKDPGGDCFTVGFGGAGANKNIALYNCIADNASRNGLSISNAVNFLVVGGEYKNSNRFPPQFGIDVEPDPLAGYDIQNVNIISVYTSNNAGGGISVVPPLTDGPVSVNISDWTSNYDGQNGGFLASNGGLAATSKMGGSINVSDSTIINPQTMGVHVQLWDEYAPQLKIENVKVVNPGSNPTLSAASVLFRTGVLINREVSQVLTSLGDIIIKDVSVQDTRAVPNTFTPYYLRNNGATPFKNIQIINPSGNVWTNSNIQPTLVTGVIEDVSIKYDDGFLVNNQATQTLEKHFIGTTIAAASSSNFTLPLAQDVIGAEFSFLVNNPGLVLIVLQGSDFIEGYSSSPAPAANIISRTVGARITLKAVAANRWQALNATSGWGTQNYFGPRYPMTFNSAAPSAGTWERGDIIFNKEPSAGGKVGWVCTTAGSPGTWKAFGVIDV